MEVFYQLKFGFLLLFFTKSFEGFSLIAIITNYINPYAHLSSYPREEAIVIICSLDFGYIITIHKFIRAISYIQNHESNSPLDVTAFRLLNWSELQLYFQSPTSLQKQRLGSSKIL